MTQPQGYPRLKEFDPKKDYVMGHGPSEVRRLISQAEILRPITTRLLEATNIQPGMRVLDLGCGAGDVSMLAAEMVGPSGTVVGIDQSSTVLITARERAEAAGLRNVEFLETSVESFDQPQSYDLAVGRYVLMHQADPTAFLKAAANMVRSGGSLALHEIFPRSGQYSDPPIAEYELALELAFKALRAGAPHAAVGTRLAAHFSEAGLPQPHLTSEIPIDCGETSPFYAWLSDSLRSLLPQIAKHGIMDVDSIHIDGLESRLRTEAVRLNSQITMPAQVCAWSRL